MEYLKIKNWEEYQHYKDRNPPWIKLHVRILKDRQFISLAGASRGLLMQLWILASEHGGEIPYDLDEIQFQLRDYTITMDQLNVLIDKGFLKNCKQGLADASTMQAGAVPETETETETETEEEVAKPSIESDIITLCDEIAKQIDKRVFNPYSFNNKNKRKRPEARFKTLTRCKEELEKDNEDFKADPWPYLEHILKVEHQNANEREVISEHDARKAEELGFDPRGIVEGLQRNRRNG